MAEAAGKSLNHILELKDIYKDFDGLEVLFGINLGIQQGERHAIIGPNGAGKSTIFNIITGKYFPRKGKIFFKGQDITGISPYKLNRQGMARSFQITNIFRTMTVFQNVRNAILSKNRIRYNLFSRLDKMEEINQQTEKVLEQIGLLDR
jgi:branched-chain amino acid transport system ATP-binding protein